MNEFIDLFSSNLVYLTIGVATLSILQLIVTTSGNRHKSNEIDKIVTSIKKNISKKSEITYEENDDLSANIFVRKKEVPKNNIESESEPTISDPTWPLVESLIKSYHRQALTQASIQFYFSIFAAIIGLVLLCFIFMSNLSASEVALSSLPILITETIAALFFRQAEQTRQRANDLYDRLRIDNKRDIAIELINSITDETLRSVSKAQLALKMGDIDASITDISNIITNKKKDDHPN